MSPVDIEAMRRELEALQRVHDRSVKLSIGDGDEIESLRAERDEARAALAAMTEERDKLRRALVAVRTHLHELEWRDLPDIHLAIGRIDKALGVTHGD